MTRPERRGDGFVAFYRGYTKTWVHALSTVALTAFGTLTTVHRLFAVVAIVAYLLPLLVQYARYASGETDRRADGAEPRAETDGSAGTDGGSATGVEHGESAESAEPAEPTREEPTKPTPEESAEPTPTTESDRTTQTAQPAEPDAVPEPRWTAADSPTDETLFDAVVAGATAYAVGSGGTLLVGDRDDGWRVALSDGPAAQSNALRGVDAVPDGGVWFAGDGGAVGRLDPETGRHVDYSAPNDDTSNVAAVAAAGEPGDETVLLADGSGRVRRGRYREESELAWDDPIKPGSGSSIAEITLDDEVGYLCDTNDGVYATRDGGRTFESVGPAGADGTLTDVTASESETCLVADDDGVVHRYGGTAWTPERLGDDPLHALSTTGNRAVASADDGVVYERFESNDWDRVSTPTSASLRGVAVSESRTVAVGDDGNIVERVVGTE